MEKALNRLYKGVILLLLLSMSTILGSLVLDKNRQGDDIRELKGEVQQLAASIDSLQMKMRIMDDIHPSVKKN